jgi:S-adenosylmethionine/arginine decarboxylase-like enzyme
MEDVQPWGYHLILDCSGADHESITSHDNVYNFTKEVVEKIDMVAYGEPQIVKFGSGNKAGFTLVQLIETSNICAHFCDDTDTFYLDVFSCKTFDPQIVLDLCIKYFKVTGHKAAFINRQA